MRRLWGLAALMAVVLIWAAIKGYAPSSETLAELQGTFAATPSKSSLVSPIPDFPVTATLVPASYSPLEEIRDLWVRPWTLEAQYFELVGTVVSIYVAPDGYGYELGDAEDYRDFFRTMLLLRVAFPNGSSDFLTVGFRADLEGVYKGEVVVVGGHWVGTHSAENRLGGEVAHPLVIADYVERIG